jgi:hypothetical protein
LNSEITENLVLTNEKFGKSPIRTIYPFYSPLQKRDMEDVTEISSGIDLGSTFSNALGFEKTASRLHSTSLDSTTKSPMSDRSSRINSPFVESPLSPFSPYRLSSKKKGKK